MRTVIADGPWKRLCRASGAAIVAALGLLVLSGPVAARSHPRSRATVSLTAVPGVAVPGSSFNVAGSGMPALRHGTVSLGSARVARFTVDARGDWLALVRVPSRLRSAEHLRVTVGARRITAWIPYSRHGYPGWSTTSVTALSSGQQARLAKTGGLPGSSVPVRATGFRRHARIAVWLARRRLRTLRASHSGVAEASVRIPAKTRPGIYALTVRSGGTRIGLRFVVTTRRRPNPPGLPVHPPGKPVHPPGSPAPPTGSPAPPTGSPSPPTGSPTPPPPASDPVVDAVGDMACAPNDGNYNNGNGNPLAVYPANNCLGRYVSDLVVNQMPTALLELGDNQQGAAGSTSQWQAAFGPTFGRANSVAYPGLGNAEYGNQFNGGTSSAPTGFFNYFQNAGVFSRIAATPGADTSHIMNGYYSFDLGTWHLIALNSNCASNSMPVSVGDCRAGGPEETWLKQDLANNQNAGGHSCVLAFWHHPLYSGSANDPASQPWWQDLYQYHATLVLNGHGGNSYQRFAPQDANGTSTPNGIRQFVSSAGGLSHTVPPSRPPSTLQIANYDTFGVLRLTLHAASYSWQFIPAANDGQGTTFTDSGSAACAH